MYKAMWDLTNKVAVVTGGGRSIGLACSQALAEFGAQVVIADINMEVANQGKAELAKHNIEADLMELDIRDSNAVNAAANEIKNKYGKVDILVNNAATAEVGVACEDVEDEFWMEHMRILMDGVFYTCRAFGNIMLEQKSGSIVNMGSISGFIVNKPQPQSYYNAAKAGIHIYTKSLAMEWATRGVRVNGVAPCCIDTPLCEWVKSEKEMYKTWLDMHPMGRMGQPSEVASTVAFMASDASSFMTGTILNVDAGYTAI